MSNPPSGWNWGSSQRQISSGDMGGDVLGAQSVLYFLNYLTGSETTVLDGNFGPLTKSAVESFQSSNGLTVDGIVGPMTWAKLQSYIQQDRTDFPWELYKVNVAWSTDWFGYQTSTGYWCVQYPAQGNSFYWMEDGFYVNMLGV